MAKKAGAPDIGDRFEQVRLHRTTRIAAALLRESLIDLLSGMGRRIGAFSPVSFTADPKQDNLLRDLPNGPAVPPWLSVIPAYDLDVRSVRLDQHEPFVAIALDARARRRITATCEELSRVGVPLAGHYVGTKSPTKTRASRPS